MNPHFVEILSTLSANRAEFLVVGAHALAVHGLVRATGDLDIGVRPSKENARRVWKALAEFGAPLNDVSEEDLARPGVVFQIGVVPSRIDILTHIDGVEFEDAWESRIETRFAETDVPVLSREHFLQNKKKVGRPKDIADIAQLESD